MLGYRVIPRENRFNFTEVDQMISSFRDYDGNRYETVIINGQRWIASNLRVTHYADGTDIPYIATALAWLADTDGAYCIIGML